MNETDPTQQTGPVDVDEEPGPVLEEHDVERVNGAVAQDAERTYGSFWDPTPPPRMPGERGGAFRAALAVFIAGLLGAGVGGAVVYVATDASAGAGNRVVVNVADPPAGRNGSGENAAARVARAVLPSIVQVQVRGALSEGLGSGVIYSSDGYILTNNHVVADASEIQVGLSNGEELPAQLVGTAANIGVDIAVLKVAPEETLPAAVFGRSKDLAVGETAVAIGSPFGLEATVTSGIISALHRNIEPAPGVRFTDAIQTDAPINQGNSGGALANARGEVIGINTAILGGEGNVGIGIAIPIDIARKVADQIIETGSAQLAYLGIQGENLPGGEGAFIQAVEPGTPADEAGLRRGDVIVEMDGEKIASMDALIALLIDRDVNERVAIVVDRDGRRVTLQATLAARPER